MGTLRLVMLAARALTVGMLLALSLGHPAGARAQEPADEEPGTAVMELDAVAFEADWLALQDWVSQLRGLPAQREVPHLLLPPAEFRERQAEIYGGYLNTEDLESAGQLRIGLGLLNPSDDLALLLRNLYGAVPMGLYDPITGTLLVRSDRRNGPLERAILAHELTHALQDQHYGLNRLLPRPTDNTDRDLAVSTLLEGDALIVQEMYRATTQPETEEEQAFEAVQYDQALSQIHFEIAQLVNFEFVPAPVVDQMYFPYLDGPRFIQAVIGDEALLTWGAYGPAMHRLFTSPPQSTMEVIHPDKYLRGTRPLEVTLPPLATALGADWQSEYHQIIGELDHRLLVERYVGQARGVQAADGWAGNSALVLRNTDGATATVSETRWDTPDDAAEWGDAYAEGVEGRYGIHGTLVWAEAGRRIWQVPDAAIAVYVGGTRTVTITAPSVAAAEALLDALDAPPTNRS